MTIGTVKMFNSDRGFGFVVPDSGGADVFVHIKDCAEDIEYLEKGQRVRFDERPSQRHSGKLEAYAVALLPP